MVDASSPFAGLLVNFSAAFGSGSFQNFTLLVNGWILVSGRRTIAGVVRCLNLAGWSGHHSVFYRFFSRAVWNVDKVSRILVWLVLQHIPGTEVFLTVDDTLNTRSGPQLWGAGMHHDAVGSSYGRRLAKRVVNFAFGHSWVVLCLYVPLPWNPLRGAALPVLFRLYRSKKRCPATEYRKRPELALELIRLLRCWVPADRKLIVLGDREYTCETVVKGRPDGVELIGPMPMNAACYDAPVQQPGRGRPRKKGERLPSPEQLCHDPNTPWGLRPVCFYGAPCHMLLWTHVGLWYGVAGERLGLIVVTRDPKGHLEDRAYFCTDPAMAPEIALEGYSHRWTQEIMHRDAKQVLAVGDPQNGWWRRPNGQRRSRWAAGPQPDKLRGAKAASRTFPFVLVVYSIVVVWYLRQGQSERDAQRVRRGAPWYRHKAHPSFADMLAAARREILRQAIFAGPASLLGFLRNSVAPVPPRRPASAKEPTAEPPPPDIEFLLELLTAG